jgi:hypothetical protein
MHRKKVIAKHLHALQWVLKDIIKTAGTSGNQTDDAYVLPKVKTHHDANANIKLAVD